MDYRAYPPIKVTMITGLMYFTDAVVSGFNTGLTASSRLQRICIFTLPHCMFTGSYKGFTMGIGFNELLLILLIVVLLFGAKKIPEIAKGLGLGVREFRKASHDSSGTDAPKPDTKNDDAKHDDDKPRA